MSRHDPSISGNEFQRAGRDGVPSACALAAHTSSVAPHAKAR
jgi:hypothetical protein